MALLAPIVNWMIKKEDNTFEDANLFDAGVVDAGSISNEFTFFLWSNHGGTEETYSMQNVRITSKDINGGMHGIPYSSEVVEGKWLEVKSISNGDTDFTPVGADFDPVLSDYVEVAHYIGANGATITPDQHKIGGKPNDGTIINTDNYVELVLRVNIPSAANAGRYDYKTRVRYSFGTE